MTEDEYIKNDLIDLIKLRITKQLILLDKEIEKNNPVNSNNMLKKMGYFIVTRSAMIKDSIVGLSIVIGAIYAIYGPLGQYFQQKRDSANLKYNIDFIENVNAVKNAKSIYEKNQFIFILSGYDHKELIPFLLNEIPLIPKSQNPVSFNIEDIVKCIKLKVDAENLTDNKSIADKINDKSFNRCKEELDFSKTQRDNLKNHDERAKIENYLKFIQNYHSTRFDSLLRDYCSFIRTLDTTSYNIAKNQFSEYCQ